MRSGTKTRSVSLLVFGVPRNNPLGEQIDDEGDVDLAGPAGDVADQGPISPNACSSRPQGCLELRPPPAQRPALLPGRLPRTLIRRPPGRACRAAATASGAQPCGCTHVLSLSHRQDNRLQGTAATPTTSADPVPRQVVGRIYSRSKVGMVGSASPRCTSWGRFQAMASWGPGLVVLEAVVLGPFGQHQGIVDLVEGEPLVLQRPEPALPRAVPARGL
mgnify:CR=1 FL=1